MAAKRTVKKKPKTVSRAASPRKSTAKTGTSRARKRAAPKATVKKKAAVKAKVTRKAKPAATKSAGRAVKEARPGKKPPAKKTPRIRLNLKAFRRQLLGKQAKLLEAYNTTKDDTRDRQTDGSEDYIDYAVSSYDREFLLSLTELEKSQLALVDEALKRIDQGKFGRCLQCAKPIPGKRLEVQPWASYCIRCQELVDQGLGGDFDDASDDDDADASPEDGEDEDVEGEVGAEGAARTA